MAVGGLRSGIRSVRCERDAEGVYQHVRIVFGPHHFLELHLEDDGRVTFRLGATHHGFKADASELMSELEVFIEEIRSAHPENRID